MFGLSDLIECCVTVSNELFGKINFQLEKSSEKDLNMNGPDEKCKENRTNFGVLRAKW